MMDNRLLLAQARKAIAFQIAQSPAYVSVKRPVMVPNGYGGEMPDPNGATTTVTETGRISHERNEIQKVGQVPSGLDTSLSKWYLGPHTCVFQDDEILTDTVTLETYKLGARDPLRKFGGIQAVQFPLYPAGSVPSGLVVSVSIDQIDPQTIAVSGTVQLTTSILPTTAVDQSVTWSSDNEAVATVDADGLVTGVGAGTCSITVTTNEGSHTDSIGIEVTA